VKHANIPPPPKSKKFRYKIKNIAEFVQKMGKMTMILPKVLSYDDIEWAGVRQVFHAFYDRLKVLL